MGTSDPDQPLTMDGEPVERTGENGCFGVEAKLYYGKNYFVFRNGDKTLTLNLRRTDAGGDGTTNRDDAAGGGDRKKRHRGGI